MQPALRQPLMCLTVISILTHYIFMYMTVLSMWVEPLSEIMYFIKYKKGELFTMKKQLKHLITDIIRQDFLLHRKILTLKAVKQLQMS